MNIKWLLCGSREHLLDIWQSLPPIGTNVKMASSSSPPSIINYLLSPLITPVTSLKECARLPTIAHPHVGGSSGIGTTKNDKRHTNEKNARMLWKMLSLLQNVVTLVYDTTASCVNTLLPDGVN